MNPIICVIMFFNTCCRHLNTAADDSGQLMEENMYTVGHLQKFTENNPYLDLLETLDKLVIALPTNDIRKGKTGTKCYRQLASTVDTIPSN